MNEFKKLAESKGWKIKTGICNDENWIEFSNGTIQWNVCCRDNENWYRVDFEIVNLEGYDREELPEPSFICIGDEKAVTTLLNAVIK